MPTAARSSEFRPELLSVREREVLDLAIEGRTDEQIAQALELSTSTVNSYWVRIRGKVGFSSRTELVSKMLRTGFKETHDGLLQEVERLKAELAALGGGRAFEAETPWHMLALHLVPEAVLVAEAPGDVVYANLQAERLFNAEPGALVGRAVCELTVPDGREGKRTRIRSFMEAEVPGRMVMGVEEPCYALDGHEGNFRATIAVEGFRALEGFMGVFTVKEFLGGVEDVLRSLRKPLAVA